MRKKQARLKILGLFLVLILVGCMQTQQLGIVKSYGGPELPQSEIAILTMDGCVGVKTLDGERQGESSMTGGIKMLPGFFLLHIY